MILIQPVFECLSECFAVANNDLSVFLSAIPAQRLKPQTYSHSYDPNR